MLTFRDTMNTQGGINMFPIRLKELRSNKGISQAKLAKELGVSVGAVGNWESGIRLPDAKTIQRIADYFNATTDYLLGRTDEKKTAPNELSLSTEQQDLITSVSELPAEDVKKTLEYVEFLKSKQNP